MSQVSDFVAEHLQSWGILRDHRPSAGHYKKIRRTWDEALFWIKREMSVTLLFWLAVAIGVLVRFLLINS
jgi:hypothetical protein